MKRWMLGLAVLVSCGPSKPAVTVPAPVVKAAAEKNRLEIEADQRAHLGIFYRSDHFSMAQAGVPAFSVATVDSTAAGDAFNGGFAVRLMRGYSPRDSAIFASAVAAISVSRHGAQPSMPTESEVLVFLNERKSDATLAGLSAD